MNTMYSVLEKIKGGFITSTMYGKYSSLTMKPPHVVVFSNAFPKLSALSKDRWKVLQIQDKELIEWKKPQGWS